MATLTVNGVRDRTPEPSELGRGLGNRVQLKHAAPHRRHAPAAQVAFDDLKGDDVEIELQDGVSEPRRQRGHGPGATQAARHRRIRRRHLSSVGAPHRSARSIARRLGHQGAEDRRDRHRGRHRRLRRGTRRRPAPARPGSVSVFQRRRGAAHARFTSRRHRSDAGLSPRHRPRPPAAFPACGTLSSPA